jgi:putative hydrolase of the HAD superfamily
MPLRAVIFDYGLVLSCPPVPAARAKMLEIAGLSPEIFDAHYWKYRLDYDRGTLNGRTYWQNISRDAGLSLTPRQVETLVEQDVLLWATVDPVMLDWATRIQAAGFRTAILSNMGEELLAHMRENFGWLDRFHHLTWSCELRTVKPEARIYRHTLENLGVQSDEALFLDDKPENVEGARAVGIHALLFRNPQTLQRDLERDGAFAALPPVIA